MRTDNIVNIEDLEPVDFAHGRGFSAQLAPVGGPLGLTHLGCNVAEYPPGKAAFPMHAHRNNDELFFVLEGTGEIRIGKETHAIGPGDFVGLPANSGRAHQIRNAGETPLRVIALSSFRSPDVVEYPEQGKLGVAVFSRPMGEPDPDGLRKIFRVDDAVDYWDGVDDAEDER